MGEAADDAFDSALRDMEYGDWDDDFELSGWGRRGGFIPRSREEELRYMQSRNPATPDDFPDLAEGEDDVKKKTTFELDNAPQGFSTITVARKEDDKAVIIRQDDDVIYLDVKLLRDAITALEYFETDGK